VFGETPSEGVVFHCADACVTVVVVDDEGGPSSIPFVLDPQTHNQQLRYQVRAAPRRAGGMSRSLPPDCLLPSRKPRFSRAPLRPLTAPPLLSPPRAPAQYALRRRGERLAMRQALLKEAAAKRLLDGSLTRLTSYGSCNLLVPLAGALSGNGSGALAPGVTVARSSSAGAAEPPPRPPSAGPGSGGGGAAAPRWSSGGGGSRRASEAGGVSAAFAAAGHGACSALGLVPASRIDAFAGAAAQQHPASAPVSPAVSPRSGGGGGGGAGAPGAPPLAGPVATPVQPLVGSYSGQSAHEYFDNW
jgi:hypothetical protein